MTSQTFIPWPHGKGDNVEPVPPERAEAIVEELRRVQRLRPGRDADWINERENDDA